MSRAIYLTLLLSLVTFPYRVFPMLFLGDLKLPKFFNSLFYYIPYAVLSALVLPDVLSATGNYTTALVGTLAAVIVSCFTENSLWAMLLSVIASYVTFCLI